jgi:MFS family permease
VLLGAVFLTTFVAGAAAVAMPQIGSALRLSFSTALLVQAAQVLAATLVLVPAGRVADAHGRRRYLFIGLALFTVSSVVAALAPSATVLVAARLGQGVAGALIAATNQAMLVMLFPAAERGRAVGMNVVAVYIGVSLGPVIGGLLTAAFGWRSVFAATALIAGVLAVALPLLRWPADPREPGRGLDVRGSLLLAGALGPAMVALTYAPLWGYGSNATLALALISVLALAAFLTTERRTVDPVLELRLLQPRSLFGNAALTTLLYALAHYAVPLLVSLDLQLVRGRSAVTTGLVLVVQPIAMAGLTPIFGRSFDRAGSRVLVPGGLAAAALALVGLAFFAESGSLVVIAVCLGLLGAGMSAFSTPNEAAALGALPADRFATAGAILAAARNTGQFLSLAILGAVAASHLDRAGQRALLLRGASHATLTGFGSGLRPALLVAAAASGVGALVAFARPRSS